MNTNITPVFQSDVPNGSRINKSPIRQASIAGSLFIFTFVLPASISTGEPFEDTALYYPSVHFVRGCLGVFLKGVVFSSTRAGYHDTMFQ